MTYLIWIGAAISVLGLLGILYSIIIVTKARRSGIGDEEMREKLANVIPLNIGSLFLSVIGLMCVVFGIMLS